LLEDHRHRPLTDGFIIGTSLKQYGDVTRPVDQDWVKALANKVR
jgi:predicted TIM-barrel enzyme